MGDFPKFGHIYYIVQFYATKYHSWCEIDTEAKPKTKHQSIFYACCDIIILY